MSRTLELHLRARFLPASDETCASAFVIPGSDAREWIDVILRLDTPLKPLRLWVLPGRRHRREAGAVLVTGLESTPRSSDRAISYRALVSGVYAPLDAVLEPVALEEEIAEVIASDVAIFHPALGLVAFAETDALCVSDLLSRPREIASEWGAARPGDAPAPRLVSVSAAPLESLEDALSEGGDEIGSESVRELRRSPRSGGFLGRVAESASGAVAGGLAGIARGFARLTRSFRGGRGRAPESPALGASGGPSRRRLFEWLRAPIGEVLGRVSERLEAARFREISRLLDLLEKDPDAGLKYAIPIADTAPRGPAAIPGARLGERPIDLDLLNSGGDTAADVWEMPWEYQAALIERYREAARRELALGRHRRAAYVFAALLGDFGSAANALEHGAHYREAAAIYRVKLRDERQAARCLESGGLLLDARELYKKLGEHEKVGTLSRKLGDDEAALTAFTRAVKALVDRGETMRAARLLEFELGDAREAAGLLERSWRGESPSLVCFEAYFDLLERQDWGEEAARVLRELRDGEPRGRERLARSLVKVARFYPESSVRGEASETVYAFASHVFGEARAEPRTVRLLASALSELADQDRLLRSDTQRFVQECERDASRREAARARRGAERAIRERPERALPVVAHLSLPPGFRWRSFEAAPRALWAAGASREGGPHRRLAVVRQPWRGEASLVEWPLRSPLERAPFLALNATRVGECIVGCPGEPGLGWRSLEPVDGRAFRVGLPPWVPEDARALVKLLDGGLVCVCESRSLLFGRSGAITETGDAVPIEEGAPVLGVVAQGVAWVASGWMLSRPFLAGEASLTVMLPGPILSLSSPYAVRDDSTLVVTWDAGAAVLARDGALDLNLVEDLSSPVATFLPDGRLVIAASEEIKVLERRGERFSALGVFRGLGSPPRAVFATGARAEFALLSEDNDLWIHRLKS